MVAKLRALLLKYKEQLLYLIFGGLTTAIDWAVTFLLYHFWLDAVGAPEWMVHIADVIAWVAAVTFAYVTNRRWVFASDKRGFLPVVGELVSFAGGRVATLLIQEAIVAVFFTWLGANKYVVRVAAAVVVIVLNHFISKLLVFRNKKTEE